MLFFPLCLLSVCRLLLNWKQSLNVFFFFQHHGEFSLSAGEGVDEWVGINRGGQVERLGRGEEGVGGWVGGVTGLPGCDLIRHNLLFPGNHCDSPPRYLLLHLPALTSHKHDSKTITIGKKTLCWEPKQNHMHRSSQEKKKKTAVCSFVCTHSHMQE